MILFSFNESKGYALFTGFTLKWYQSLLHNSSILRALAVSVEVALGLGGGGPLCWAPHASLGHRPG